MKLRYTVEGADASNAEYKVIGEIEGVSPLDPGAQEFAGRAAFRQLTSGKAVYLKPGQGGCRGPYKVTRFTLEIGS